MKRILIALMAGAAVFTIAFASAAALGVNGNVIQAGVDTDVSCDTDGVNANWGLETDTNSDGSYLMCGSARGAQVTVKVSIAGRPTVQERFSVPENLVLEHDFVLGGR